MLRCDMYKLFLIFNLTCKSNYYFFNNFQGPPSRTPGRLQVIKKINFTKLDNNLHIFFDNAGQVWASVWSRWSPGIPPAAFVDEADGEVADAGEVGNGEVAGFLNQELH